jgi:hypothetical protein
MREVVRPVSWEVQMNRLTQEERRRVFLAQQKAREAMLARPAAGSAPRISAAHSDRAGLRRLLKTAMIVTLLGGGLLAYQALEFHLPASLVEALLPRL